MIALMFFFCKNDYNDKDICYKNGDGDNANKVDDKRYS